MDASIRPKGILDFLSQQEIRQLSDPQNGGLNELFRRCALAVLNSDSQTDSGKEMLAGFRISVSRLSSKQEVSSWN